MTQPATPKLLLTLLSVLPVAMVHADDGQQFAEFGECPLSGGGTIAQCRLGYRTWGEPNAGHSNVILFPTWYGGTSGQLAEFGYIGPGLLADTSKYFVVAVDVWANGVSSSPSNSSAQPGLEFPEVSIADMVDSQYRLLSERLDIEQLHAVVGISMGGMQAFEWAVRYPAFMDKAVAVIGTPRQTAYDILLWDTQLHTITMLGETEAADRIIAGIDNLVSYTPGYFVDTTPPGRYREFIAQSVRSVSASPLLDRVPQLKAMIAHDVTLPYGGSFADAAARVRAEMLIVVSPTDHMVNPAPSRAFAAAVDATLVELPGACGHLAVACERSLLQGVVQTFLDGPPPAD